MRLFSRSKKEGDYRIALIFDIGSSSVGAALVLLHSEKPARVLYTTRRLMVFQAELNYDRFTSAMFDTLRAVVDDIEQEGLPHLTFTKEGKRHVSHILVSYASPWYVARVATIEETREHPFEITQDFVNDIVSREEGHIASQQEVSDTTLKKIAGDAYSIERHVVAIKLGGYTVGAPFGMKTKNVALTVAMTVLSDSVRKKIAGMLASRFNDVDVVHHSFALSGFTVIRDLPKSPPDFLFIDVGGEVTDIALVRGDTLLEVVSFPEGKNALIRNVAAALSISYEEAGSTLRLLGDNTLDATRRAAVEPIFREGRARLQESLRKALGRFSHEMVIPNTVYLTADQDLVHIFKECIEGSDEGGVLFGGVPDVRPVTTMLLGKNILFRSGVSHDPFIALLTLYFNKLVTLV